jgi:hypothetical protein
MKTKTIAALTVAAALTLGLSACSAQHATLEDCAAYYQTQSYTADASYSDLITTCATLQSKLSVATFDERYGK